MGGKSQWVWENFPYVYEWTGRMELQLSPLNKHATLDNSMLSNKHSLDISPLYMAQVSFPELSE